MQWFTNFTLHLTEPFFCSYPIGTLQKRPCHTRLPRYKGR